MIWKPSLMIFCLIILHLTFIMASNLNHDSNIIFEELLNKKLRIIAGDGDGKINHFEVRKIILLLQLIISCAALMMNLIYQTSNL